MSPRSKVVHITRPVPPGHPTFIAHIHTDRRTHIIWRLYFAGLNFRELLFENISLKKIREFAVKRHAHRMGVVYYTALA